MKILGFTVQTGPVQLVMKSDSSLLSNRKPFFLPEGGERVVCTPCWVVRIGRLGKHIGEKFASRYCDAVAWGLNFGKPDVVAAGGAAEAWAFDYSLAVGRFMPADHPWWQEAPQPCMTVQEAIAKASEVMTLRQGDLVFIDTLASTFAPEPEQVVRMAWNNEELLYCKIK